MNFTLPAYAEYILMEPSEAYMPFIEQMRVKVHMAKIVIEFLSSDQDASYEDLLNRIQVIFIPNYFVKCRLFFFTYAMLH